MFAFVLCLVVMLGQNYQALLKGQVDWYGAISTCVGLVLFVAIWGLRKLCRPSAFVGYPEMDFPGCNLLEQSGAGDTAPLAATAHYPAQAVPTAGSGTVAYRRAGPAGRMA